MRLPVLLCSSFCYYGLAYFFEYHLAKKNPTGETEGIAHKHIIEVFKKKLLLTLGFCVIFFVFVAGTIYVASYVPFEDSAKITPSASTK